MVARRLLLNHILLFITYFTAARFGLMIEPEAGFASLVWAPSGIALGALILGGLKLSPTIFIAAAAANFVSGAPIFSSLFIGLGNMGEAVLGALIVIRACGICTLDRVAHVLYLSVAALVAPIISATVGVTVLLVNGTISSSQFVATWEVWWLGDVIGITIITPLLLVWWTNSAQINLRKLNWWQPLEAMILGTLIVFNLLQVKDLGWLSIASQSRIYILIPLVVWTAIRFGQRGATLVTLFVSAALIYFTIQGEGQFATKPLYDGLYYLQLFIGVSALTGLLCGALEEESIRAHKRFELAFEAAPNSMILVDENGKILFANHETESLLDYKAEELVGRQIDTLVPKQFRAKHSMYREEFVKSPTRRPMGEGRDLFALRKDGTEVPVEIGLTPFNFPGEGVLVVASILDLTQRKKAEIALKSQAIELERSNSDLEQFAYIASHDLREPLRTISGFIGLLADSLGSKLTERENSLIASIRGGVERMRTIMDDILLYSRVGRAELYTEWVDCNKVLENVKQNLARIIAESKAEIRSNELPTIRANSTMISLVFQNLISNALKFKKGEPPIVMVDYKLEASASVISVSDNGIGFDLKFKDRIFEVFQRLHTRERYPGTGIGLALVKRVVERYGGRVWADSIPGDGSTFFLSFPKSMQDEVFLHRSRGE